VPISGLVSYRPVRDFWIHPLVAYTIVHAFGDVDFGRFTLGGTAATRSVQVGLTLQYQITSVISLTLWSRVQVFTGQIAVSGSGAVDASTTATVDARITPGVQHPFAVVPGVAFLWKHFRFTVGAGYGNFFVPGAEVSLRGAGFVPDAS